MGQDIIINGLINGSIYALLAIGFSLIFGVARIVNIAHTALYMTTAYLIYIGLVRFGLPSLLVIPTSILLTAIVGLVSYHLFIKPIREHESAVLIATIALAMAIQEIFLLGLWGSLSWGAALGDRVLGPRRRQGGTAAPTGFGGGCPGVDCYMVPSIANRRLASG